MTCPCDKLPELGAPAIVAGQGALPRLIHMTGGFPEIRQRLLAGIPLKAALDSWRARDDRDFGVMLLEFGAYVGDVLAFYDEVLAHEAYLRTARLRPSLHKLVSLIGYRPRPAVASSVRVALLAEGKSALALPAGTAFRSGAFEGSPPQIFESTSDETLHPALNKFLVKPPQPTAISGTFSSIILEASTAKVKAGQIVLIEFHSSSPTARVRVVTSAQRITGDDGRPYVEMKLDRAIELAAPCEASEIHVLIPTRTSAVIEIAKIGGHTQPNANDITLPSPLPSDLVQASLGEGNLVQQVEQVGQLEQVVLSQVPVLHNLASSDKGTRIRLDGVYRGVQPGTRMIISVGHEHRWFEIQDRIEKEHTLKAKDGDIPAIKITVSRPRLIGYMNQASKRNGGTVWSKDAHLRYMTARFEFVEVGRGALAALPTLADTDALNLAGVRPPWYGGPSPAPDRLLLRDINDRGVDLQASIHFSSGQVSHAGADWDPPLALPVTAYANVVELTRGETVPLEVLGSGDSSIATQSFELKKGPLTFLPSPTANNDWGVKSTLRVWVDGLEWYEVDTLFGHGADAQVFIVRLDEEGRATVAFGDGVRGARLPTGANNVIARYRFGAGAKAPPALSIAQLAKPVKGVKAVVQPVAAGGGDDPEHEEQIRENAPRTAMLLGRAVSIDDLEALAAATPGVRSAAAEWRWDGTRQRATVKVWYVGTVAQDDVRKRLRSYSDPATPIDAELAAAIVPSLTIDVETDAARIASDVVKAVRAHLTDQRRGMLALANLGIGKPVFRSALVAEVLRVPGALGVRALTWNGSQFLVLGKTPGSGHYFDFSSISSLTITGSP